MRVLCKITRCLTLAARVSEQEVNDFYQLGSGQAGAQTAKSTTQKDFGSLEF